MKKLYTFTRFTRVMPVMAFLFILTFQTFAQNENYQFGRLEQEDMSMQVCPIDDAASAVIICDLGKIWFAREVDKFVMVYERFMRYKILSDEGVSNNTIAIPIYYEGLRSEKLSDLKLNVWNEHDNMWKAVKFTKKSVDYKVINDNYELAVISVPGLTKGSIVEYKYEITSPFFMPVHGWEFQSGLPTLLSFLEIRMIPFYEYTFLHQGREPDIKESFKDKTEYNIGRNTNQQYGYIKYNEIVYHFGMLNTPATDSNPMRIDFQLSKQKDINGIGVTLTDTWEKATKELLKDDRFGDFIDKSESRANSLIDRDSYTSMKPADRLSTIVHQVKQQYKWNGILGKYAQGSLNELIKSREGNSGAINLHTIGLLRAAGVNAFPVILSTNTNPAIKTNYPFLHLYDYVLIGARINDSIVLADATEPLLPDNMLPMRTLNTRGLLVEKNTEKWINCTTTTNSETATSLVIHVSGSNELYRAELVKHATGYDAFLLKEQFTDDKTAMAEFYWKRGYILEAGNIITRDYSRFDYPYEIDADIMVTATVSEETISIDPFLNEAINVNPLKEESRTYQTDFYYPLNKTFTSEIIVPEGYTVAKMPEDFTMSNSLFVMNYKAVAEPGRVHITADYRLTKSIYQPNEYTKIRSYLDEVVKRFNEPVVLQKGGL